MDSNNYENIRNRLASLRQEVVETSLGKIPKSIWFLESEIDKSISHDDKLAIYTLLLSECCRCRNQCLQIHYLRKQFQDFPSEPLAITELASNLAFDINNLNEVLELLKLAVSMARLQNRLVKYSLTCQARVALQLKDYLLFNNTLRALIDDAHVSRADDYDLEFDFIKDINKSLADLNLIDQYRSLSKC